MTNFSLLFSALVLAFCTSAYAQSLRPGSAGAAPALPSLGSASVDVDRIVALVNAEPITLGDVRTRMARVESSSGATRPSPDDLARQVLEQLVIERTQIQWASEIGIRVDDAALNDAEQNVARQNGLTVAQLHERLRALGLSTSVYRQNLRNDMVLQRVREREVSGRVRVSERDIDLYLTEQGAVDDPSQTRLHLAQILLAVPDNASEALVAQRQAQAQQIADRARQGEDFGALARQFSDGPERANGGLMGVRPADRYPTLFVEATVGLKRGSVTAPVRSGAGFHVLQVLENRRLNLPPTDSTQTRARHILLRPTGPETEQAVIDRLRVFREQVQRGEARFEDLARLHSADGSAREGGDLGWVGPGQFVPEFEQVMDGLAPGALSEPVVSRFGVHLIQVMERREVPLSTREQRDWVREVLREQKAEQAYEDWARELRARAFVEYRGPLE
jgi:peptidyl-prolyl cis-trans isomerase SurA